jgi:hypothetical protein
MLIACGAFLWSLVPDLGHAQPALEVCATKVHDGQYCAQTLHGWSVFVSAALVERNRELARAALAVVGQRLGAVTGVLPAARLEELRRISIWIGNNTERLPSTYHPAGNTKNLRENRLPEAMMGSIEIRAPRSFLDNQVYQPWSILHELAHGYHDQVLGNGIERVRGAFQYATESGLYREVKHSNGSVARAYALTNHIEYFAELTEAYFGTNDYFPFRRDELREYDPLGYEAVRTLWEEWPAMAEVSLSLSGASCVSDEPPRSWLGSTDPVRIAVRNRTPGPIEMFWIDREGERQSRGRMEPGALWVQRTSTSHLWLVADPTGACLATFISKPEGSYVVLAK